MNKAKLIKIILSVVLGRIIHAGIKRSISFSTDSPDSAFLFGAVTGGASILLGFAIVFGLSSVLKKRNNAPPEEAPPRRPD